MSVKDKKYSRFQIRNVITTADLKQPINIAKLNEYVWGRFDIEDNYNGRVGYVKDSKMEGRVTVFSTGKLISTGAKSIENSIQQLETTKKLLKKSGLAITVPLEPKVQNIVATHSVGGKIDLNMMTASVKGALFEPEQFSGLIYRSPEGPVFLIFASGKMVVVGAKSEEQISNSLDIILQKLKPFIIKH